MFKNYLKIALRHMTKQRIYSAINILGLAVGLAGAILTFLFVRNELSYDRFHANSKNIYRVYVRWHAEDGSVERTFRGVTMPMAPAMEDYFPEVKHAVRVQNNRVTVKTGGGLFSERITMVDDSFFQVFSFPMIMGNSESVFAQENAVILSEEYALKYFGGENPLGKILTLINGEDMGDFVVTGVAADPPSNSSIDMNILMDIPSANRLNLNTMWLDNWEAFGWQTYVQVEDDGSTDAIMGKFPDFTNQYLASTMEKTRQRKGWKTSRPVFSFALQPMSRVHLDPLVSGTLNLSAIFILSGIAFIVLFIACVNFINLAVARASTRSMEVGVRKVLGAERRQLIQQFWGEFFILSGIAMGLGLILAELALSTFNSLAGRDLRLSTVFQPLNLLILTLLYVCVGIASGSYPALFMSRFRPVEIFRGRLKIGRKNTFARGLVVLQFSLSVFLIIASIVMGRQVHFMLTEDPGFKKEGVVFVQVQEPESEISQMVLDRYRDRLSRYPSVVSVSGTNAAIGDVAAYPFRKDGREIYVAQNRVDFDYFRTMGIEILEGRAFSQDFPSDKEGVVVNEMLVKTLEIEDPIGKPLEGYSKRLTIIGVVKDYINQDFRNNILPALHHMNPSWRIRYIMVRIAPQNIAGTLSTLESSWKEIQPNKPFLFSFLDDSLKKMYEEEQRWGAIVGYSTALAVLIACMGIFGLTAISVSRRNKEIGIRKVLGANVPQIIRTLTSEFLLLVGIANMIGWPAAYFAMKSLLNNYFFRIELGLQYFLLAGLLSFFVAVLTTVFLAVRTAVASPVKSLRYE